MRAKLVPGKPECRSTLISYETFVASCLEPLDLSIHLSQSKQALFQKSHMTDRARITVPFNLALFLCCHITGLIRFLFSDKANNIPVQGLVATSSIDLVRVIAVTLVTAYFVWQIWNRLIASVFNVRDLNIHESIALVLAVCLLAS